MSRELVEGLARTLLPDRGKRGLMAMLEFYFDDSGTHAGSPVVVWAAVIGLPEVVSELAEKWQHCLDAPCEERAPITKFSSYDLEHGDGEFVGYNLGERDLTRWKFRQAIIESGVSIRAYGLSTKDWDEVVTGHARAGLFSPEHSVFGVAVRSACVAAQAEAGDMPMAFIFDQGCARRFDLQAMFDAGVQSAGIDPTQVSFGVSPVMGNCALQAADMVAHETYQFLCRYLDDESAEMKLHMRRLYEGAYDANAGWLGRQELKEMTEGINEWWDKFSRSGGL